MSRRFPSSQYMNGTQEGGFAEPSLQQPSSRPSHHRSITRETEVQSSKNGPYSQQYPPEPQPMNSRFVASSNRSMTKQESERSVHSFASEDESTSHHSGGGAGGDGDGRLSKDNLPSRRGIRYDAVQGGLSQSQINRFNGTNVPEDRERQYNSDRQQEYLPAHQTPQLPTAQQQQQQRRLMMMRMTPEERRMYTVSGGQDSIAQQSQQSSTSSQQQNFSQQQQLQEERLTSSTNTATEQVSSVEAARNRHNAALRAEKMALLNSNVDRPDGRNGLNSINQGMRNLQVNGSNNTANQDQVGTQDPAASKAAAQAAAAAAARNKFDAALRAEKMAALGMSMDRVVENAVGATSVTTNRTATSANSNERPGTAVQVTPPAPGTATARNEHNDNLFAEKLAALGMSMDHRSSNVSNSMNHANASYHDTGAQGRTVRDRLSPPVPHDAAAQVARNRYDAQTRASENIMAMGRGPSPIFQDRMVAPNRGMPSNPRRLVPPGAVERGGVSPSMMGVAGGMGPQSGMSAHSHTAAMNHRVPGGMMMRTISPAPQNSSRANQAYLNDSNHSSYYPPLRQQHSPYGSALEQEEFMSSRHQPPVRSYSPYSHNNISRSRHQQPSPSFNKNLNSVENFSYHDSNHNTNNMRYGGDNMGNLYDSHDPGLNDGGGYGGRNTIPAERYSSQGMPMGYSGRGPNNSSYDQPMQTPAHYTSQQNQHQMYYNSPPHMNHNSMQSYESQQHMRPQPSSMIPRPGAVPMQSEASLMQQRNMQQQHQQQQSMQQQHQQQSSPPTDQMIELAPGQWVRLRGADETWACIEHDFYLPVTCFSCETELCCIQDADFVLCPGCRVVSPMTGLTDNGRSSNKGKEFGSGGVGLGFTFTDLMRWQSEILNRRGQQSQSQSKPGVFAS